MGKLMAAMRCKLYVPKAVLQAEQAEQAEADGSSAHNPAYANEPHGEGGHAGEEEHEEAG